MKKILSILCLLIASFATHAYTDITTANVSGQWTAAGSPYRIFNNITIQYNTLLKIDPGVTVVFQGPYSLTADGVIYAKGTSAAPINFTINNASAWSDMSTSSGGWQGMHITGSGAPVDTSTLQYCNISYCKLDSASFWSDVSVAGYGIIDVRRDMLVKNCNFTKISCNTVVRLFLFAGEVANCTFYSCASYTTMFTMSYGTPHFHDNKVYQNSTSNSQFSFADRNIDFHHNEIYQNTAGEATMTVNHQTGGTLASHLKIRNNKIHHNTNLRNGAIYCYDGFVDITNNLICNNQQTESAACGITHGCGGIKLWGTNLSTTIAEPNSFFVVTNNIIANNQAADFGGGLEVFGKSVITNNVIINNKANHGGGIYIAVSMPVPTVIKNNIFYGNVNNSGGTHNISGNCGALLYENNWTPRSTAHEVSVYGYSSLGDTGTNVTGGSPGLMAPTTTANVTEDATGANFGLMASSACVNAGDSTSARVLATDYAGNARISGVRIDIGANEFVLAITGSTSLCQGSSITLTGTTSGGTWSSNNATVASIGSSTGVVSGNSLGVATITYVAATGSFTTVVTVTTTPAAITGTNVVCGGGTTSLATTTGGGAWSSGAPAVANISSAGVVTGVTAGIATISYSGGGSCVATKTVTVGTAPAAISGGPGFCTGLTGTLSNATIGGTWSSSNISVAGVSSTTGVVTGGVAGTAIITYTHTGCRVTKIITVNATPPDIYGASKVCPGLTATLTNDMTGGTWSTSNSAIATIGASSGVVTGVTAGSFIVTYTLGTGCYNIRYEDVVTPAQPLTGTFSACAGVYFYMNSPVIDYLGSWTSSAPAVVSVIGTTAGTLLGMSAGTATITYSRGYSCTIATQVVTVNATPTAISGTSTVCIGLTTTLSSGGAAGVWTSSNTAIATVDAVSGLVTGIAGGTATIKYTVTAGGCFKSAVVTVMATPPAINTIASAAACRGDLFEAVGSPTGGIFTSSDTSIISVVGGAFPLYAASVGTATVTYSFGGSCVNTKVLTVRPAPSQLITTAMCTGNTTTMTNDVSGGTWTSSNTTVATVGSSTGVLSALSTGSTTITYILSSGCKVTPIVTVVSLPAVITGTSTLCSGTVTTLGNTTPTGTWSSSNSAIAPISSTGVVTGVAGGTATITYTVGSTSTCRRTLPVTVYPSASAISGSSSVCVGATTTFGNTTSGGTWTTSSSAVATIGASTGVATGVAAGTCTVTYNLPGGCKAWTVLTVNGSPAAIGGTLKVCPGMTTTLTNAISGGTWAIASTSLATISAGGIVTGITAGTTTVSYTISTGCTKTAVFTVNAMPAAITGNTSVCTGTTSVLSNSTTGGVSWMSSNTSVAAVGSSSGVVSGVSIGTATITYTINTGCIRTTVVSINAAPGAISGTKTLCAGNTTTLGNSVAGGTWSSSNAAIATAGSTGIITGVAGGTATISYAFGGMCRSTAIVTVSPILPVTGNTAICMGSNTTLACASTGGTWSSGATSVATIGTTGIVVPVSAGTANISYTLASGCRRVVTLTVSLPPSAISGPATVCAGASATFTNTASGGTWTSSNLATAAIVAGTGVLTGLSAGTTIVTYVTGPSCSATKSVTVNGTASAITGTAAICAGATTTLTNSAGGGVWSSSNAAIATIGTAGNVTGIAAGTTTISYVPGSGCPSIMTMTVNAVPSAITGALGLCAGNTTILGNSVAGGAWSSGDASVATVAGGIVSGISAGTSVISYTTAGGCGTTTVVTVSANSTISGPNTLCTGNTITLVNATGGGAWTSGNTAAATIDGDGQVTAVAAGVTAITYTTGPGCHSIRSVTVGTTPAAIGGTLYVCAGNNITLSNTAGGGTWSSSTAAVATIATTGVVSGIAAGTATITYTTGADCMATAEVTVNAMPAAISGPPVLCTGTTATLSNTTGGGVWASSDTSVVSVAADGAVAAMAPGTAIISYTIGGLCAAYKTMTVNTAPAAITGTATMCAGASATLSNTSAGGTWSSSDNSIATIGATSGIVAGATAGTAVITYESGAGCFATAIVTVSETPSAITGAIPVCIGATVTLDNAATGGNWTTSDTSIASIDTDGVVSGIAPGVVVVTYSTTAGCAATAAITVNSSPAAITGTITACAGATTALANAVTGGTWSSSNAGVATVGSSGVVAGISAGTATISYSMGGDCIVTADVTIYSAPAAITGVSGICEGATTTLSNTVTSGVWTSNDTAVAGISPGGVVTGVASGTAMISYSAGVGCASTVVMTVFAMPSAISGTASVCQGSTGTLSNTVSGGAWSSSDPSVASVASGIVSGVAVGTAIISYGSGSGCSVFVIATVNAAPPAITGTSAICLGTTTVLSNTTSGGTWSSSNTGIATVGSTGVVTGVESGAATITYMLGSGCYATKDMYINAPPPITGELEICVGGTTSLGNPEPGGVWSGLAPTVIYGPSAVGLINGINPGTAVISYTLPTGCARTTVVTVNALPPAISGTATMCPGTSTTLSDYVTGGTWSSSNGLAIIGSASGIATGVTAGTATITYRISPLLGCYITRTVTVNMAPAAIAGPAGICAGGTATFTNSSSGGTAWSSSNTSVATISPSTGVATGINAGATTITYTLGTGCIATTSFSVSALPAAIGGPGTACIGTTTTMTNTVTGGAWSSSNTSVAAIDGGSGVATGMAAGVATITYTIGAGCYKTKLITVNAAPAAISGYATPCVGFTTTLTAGSGGTWSSSNTAVGTIDGATRVVRGLTTGVTTISFTGSNGCYTTYNVTVMALPPAITGAATVCQGSTATMYNSQSGGVWTSSSAVAAIGTASGVITTFATSSGTTVISYSFGTACRVTKALTVNMLPAVIGGTASVCGGAVTTLSDVTSGGVWSSSNTAVGTVGVGASASYGAVRGLTAGVTDISYTHSVTGCSRIKTVTVNACSKPAGGEQHVSSSFELYPNPNTGKFTVVAGAPGMLHIYTIDGREVGRYILSAGGNALQLAPETAKGVYMCRYAGDDETTIMIRLVVE
ncbi:MAG: Ig-like domain-containing protein [Bacteroidota bacterium]